MTAMKNFYRGWDIRYCGGHPVTGQYRAIRHGVEICASTLEGLMRMIDLKISDLQNDKTKVSAK